MNRATIYLLTLLSISSQLFASDSDLFVLHEGIPDAGQKQNGFSYSGLLSGKHDSFGTMSMSFTSIYQGNENEVGEINGMSGRKIKNEFTIITELRSQFEELNSQEKTILFEYAVCNTDGCRYLGSSIPNGREFGHPLQIFNVPFKARIGESGIIGSYQDEEGTITNCTWFLSDAEKGDHAQLKINCEDVEGNDINAVYSSVMVIDRNGKCYSHNLTARIATDDGDVAELNGNVNCTADKHFFRFMLTL